MTNPALFSSSWRNAPTVSAADGAPGDCLSENNQPGSMPSLFMMGD